jgi:signal transduction histidine kinase
VRLRTARKNGGDIQITSRPGEGTRVDVALKR